MFIERMSRIAQIIFNRMPSNAPSLAYLQKNIREELHDKSSDLRTPCFIELDRILLSMSAKPPEAPLARSLLPLQDKDPEKTQSSETLKRRRGWADDQSVPHLASSARQSHAFFSEGPQASKYSRGLRKQCHQSRPTV